MKKSFTFLILCALMSCDDPLKKVMKSAHPSISKVKARLKTHEVQILYTQIDSAETGEVEFTDYTFQVDNNQYFYPASTVKLPMAIAAAEFTDRTEGISLDIPFVTARDKKKHTVAEDITAIFTVSDNESYNRLYAIVGRDAVNYGFRQKELPPIQIAHRLETSEAGKGERASVKFFPDYNAEVIVLKNQIDSNIGPLQLKGIKKGVGEMKDGQLLKMPMDFSRKNYFPLETQHEVMKRLIFPQNFDESERFQLTDKTRKRLLTMMQTLPREAGYTSKEYYDSYGKFFIYGDLKESIPDHIDIYNKVGMAYGTLTETAYVVDRQQNISFLLSATILVNENGIFNDDTYDYDTVGIPFLAQLGREIYDIEKKRK